MATPKKVNKIRDYDRTRKKLLEVVGEILKDTGFTGLKTNQIARRLGKDKNLIRYYFQSLYNLQKEFILEKDHWVAFFNKMAIQDQVAGDDVFLLLTAFIEEHFDNFSQNTEMQKVMLWQLTENSSLLKSIAAFREKEAEGLLNSALPFIRSDVNFRAMLALLFGGLYFLALQHASGNGPLWGIDSGNERDRKALFDTIEQIIRDARSPGDGS